MSFETGVLVAKGRAAAATPGAAVRARAVLPAATEPVARTGKGQKSPKAEQNNKSEKDAKAERRSGTQSTERAVLILKELAAQPHFGWRATDLAIRCGLDRTTTHRILASLARSRLAQQRANDRRYLPGPLLFELSVGLTGMETLRTVANDAMEKLARRAHAVAFFYLRSGDDFICVARAGTAPVQSLMFEVGTRRPLVTSAGGVAMLLAMPPQEAQAVRAENRARLARWDVSQEGMQRLWDDSKKAGYGVNRSVTVSGWNALAVAVHDATGNPVAAVMLGGIAEDFPGNREPAMLEMMRESVNLLEREIARGFDSRRRIAL